MEELDKLYTIGYIDKKPRDFIRILKEHGIDYLLDVRYLNDSKNRTEYSGDALSREMRKHGIEYEHHPELSIPFTILDAYRDGGLDTQAFVRYCYWRFNQASDYITKRRICNLEALSARMKEHSAPCIMAMYPHAHPEGRQKMICHRAILASVLRDIGTCKEVQHL